MTNEITFENRDEFERRKIAENIIKLINSDINISPLIIDGDWGTGKTEFSSKLKSLIAASSDERVVYIDAFKEDHADAPILSITAAIYSLLEPAEGNQFKRKAMPAIKFCLKTSLKAGSAWILKQDGEKISDEFKEAIKDISNKTIDRTIEGLLNEHVNLEKNLTSLKSALEEITKNKKIVLIVDELDRCKPSYAVSFLENIKHIFDSQNVIFILVANMEQLKASISHSYGSSVNAKRYLDKFSKYTINLPNTVNSISDENNNVSVIHWINSIEKSEILKGVKILKAPSVLDMILSSNISLREVETLIRHFEVYSTLSDNYLHKISAPIIGFSIIVGVFIHCFCEREIFLRNLDSSSAIEIGKKLGINTLPDGITDDQYSVEFIKITYFMLIKEAIPADSVIYQNGKSTKDRYDRYIINIIGRPEHYNVAKIVRNTCNVMSFSA
ncbi:KAP family P-loop NTPase fold protein [Siccibacter turicensis]|uniref:KAP family P-loop NTPase fold protein n=1 Tax=Siccibacter turicensis TaxID=357233 RepID=UPI0013ECD0C2|nr:P-loop NTPase fold protein [Siccibacter turicensis]